MKKNGFTLIELAIVLVIIGLLLGMAFKGKSMVEAARIKADMNKIQKISTALSTFMAKNNTLPAMKGPVTFDGGTCNQFSSCAMYQQLLDEGLLREGDFKTATATDRGAGYWWFTGCEEANGSWTVTELSPTRNVCIYRSGTAPRTWVDKKSATIDPSISGVNICQIEVMLDDKSLTTGDGRLGTIPGAAPRFDNVTWNCQLNPINNGTNTGTTNYIYRVF